MASAKKTGTNERILTYGSPSRDYDEGELSIWEAFTDNNLTAGGISQSEVLEVYDDQASFDDADALDGATCDADYFRIIRPAAGQGHDGTPNNGVHFVNTADSSLMWIGEEYSQIQDIIGTITINSGSGRLTFGASGDNSACVGCIAIDGANAGAGVIYGFLTHIASNPIFYINCLSHNNDGNGFHVGANAWGYMYNCTATDNGAYGFYRDTGNLFAKNCDANGNGTADFGGSPTKTTCNDGGSPTYVNSAGDDFHIASGDTVLRGNGTDLSGDANYPFDDDIDGDTRSAWDIGFDEYGATGGALLQAAVSCAVTVASALTTAITFAASVAASATVAAVLTTSILLGGAVSGSASTSAALTTEIKLAASVSGSASTAADLTVESGALLASSVSATVATSVALTTEITCAAAVTGQATAAGALTTEIPLASVINAQGATVANLTTEIACAASVTAQGTTVSDLTTEITLASSVSGVVTTTADLEVSIPLGPLSENLSLLFTTKRRETISKTGERSILSTSKRREAKP
jgi:hypothetical protein